MQVSLSHNSIQDMPAVAHCLELKELRLAYNHLTRLPPACLPPNLEILGVQQALFVLTHASFDIFYVSFFL